MLDSTKKSLDAVFDVATDDVAPETQLSTVDNSPLADIDISPETEASLMDTDDVPEEGTIVPKLGTVQGDFQKTRENLLKLIQQGESALFGVIGLASAGEDPKAYEAVAKVMKELREANKDLVGLHQQVLDMLEQHAELEKDKKRREQQPLGPASSPVVTQNAVIFTGTPKELLDQINKGRK
jgi:hypothetical protein